MRPPVEVKAGAAAATSGSHIPASQLEHSHLAQSLYAPEDSPDVCFVRAAVGCAGPTGRQAKGIADAVTEIWARYLPATDRVQQLVSAAAGRRPGVVERPTPSPFRRASLASAGRLSEATEVGTDAFDARRRLFGPDDLDMLGAAWNLTAILRQAGRLDPAIELLTDNLRAGQALRKRRTRADPDVGLRARCHPYPGWARLDESVCGNFRPLEMAVDR